MTGIVIHLTVQTSQKSLQIKRNARTTHNCKDCKDQERLHAGIWQIRSKLAVKQGDHALTFGLQTLQTLHAVAALNDKRGRCLGQIISKAH